MKEVQVGLRVDPDAGISFYGLDDVNMLVQSGAIILSLEPGGALMLKQGEDSETVRLRLSGFYLKVLIDDSNLVPCAVPRETD